jgi:hypothetical protein
MSLILIAESAQTVSYKSPHLGNAGISNGRRDKIFADTALNLESTAHAYLGKRHGAT